MGIYNNMGDIVLMHIKYGIQADWELLRKQTICLFQLMVFDMAVGSFSQSYLNITAEREKGCHNANFTA